MSSLLPVSSTRIALTWLVPILRACRLYPVRYRLRTVPYPFGELYQFPVQVRSRSVRILRVYGALYVRGHCAVRTFCLFQMQNCISHNCNTFFG